MFRWDANVTLSQNQIKDYVAYLPDADWLKGIAQPARKHTTISFSPSVVANNRFTVDYRGFTASLTSQYVGRQYLDNMELRENSLDAYFVSHLSAAYSFRLPSVKEVTIGATVYNLFNAKYETNGYSQSNVDGTGTVHHDPRFYPMAGTNFLVNVGLKF